MPSLGMPQVQFHALLMVKAKAVGREPGTLLGKLSMLSNEEERALPLGSTTHFQLPFPHRFEAS